MPRGPLPDPHAVRRNAPDIPATELPRSGRKGPIPKVPAWSTTLGKAGSAWWRWAWRTPEACGWSDSLIDVVARRASLVDDLWSLDQVDGLDVLKIADAEDPREVKFLIQRIAALATGRITLLKAMADLDAQLGLGAKNLAALRWKIVDDAPVQRTKGSSDPVSPASSGGSRGRLSVVRASG